MNPNRGGKKTYTKTTIHQQKNDTYFPNQWVLTSLQSFKKIFSQNIFCAFPKSNVKIK